jgi:hypothetical protein
MKKQGGRKVTYNGYMDFLDYGVQLGGGYKFPLILKWQIKFSFY